MPYHISEADIASMERVLNRGDRVEIIPVKDRIRLIHIRRKEIKPVEKSAETE